MLVRTGRNIKKLTSLNLILHKKLFDIFKQYFFYLKDKRIFVFLKKNC